MDRDFKKICETLIAFVRKTYAPPADEEILKSLFLQRDTSDNTDTALHLACRQGNLEMLELMLGSLKDPKECALEAKTAEGESLLDVAEEESHDEVIDYLRDLLGVSGGGVASVCNIM